MHKRPINYSKEHTRLKVMPFVLNERQQYYLFSARQKTTSHVPLVSPDPRPVGVKCTSAQTPVTISTSPLASTSLRPLQPVSPAACLPVSVSHQLLIFLFFSPGCLVVDKDACQGLAGANEWIESLVCAFLTRNFRE